MAGRSRRWPAPTARRRRSRRSAPSRSGRPRRPGLDRGRRGRLRGRVPFGGAGVGLGKARGLRRGKRHRHDPRPRRLRGRRSTPVCPRRNRGSATRWRAALERRRNRTTASRVARSTTRRPKPRLRSACSAPNRDGFETVVIRPRFVWGPGDQTVLPAIVEAVESGRFAWIGGGGHKTSTTHIDNCVHGRGSGPRKAGPAASTSSPMASRSSPASSSPHCSPPLGSKPRREPFRFRSPTCWQVPARHSGGYCRCRVSHRLPGSPFGAPRWRRRSTSPAPVPSSATSP